MTQTQASLAQTATVAKQQTANALATSKAGVAQTKAAAGATAAAAKQQTANALATSKAQTATAKAQGKQTLKTMTPTNDTRTYILTPTRTKSVLTKQESDRVPAYIEWQRNSR
jgi:hypothetical protein